MSIPSVAELKAKVTADEIAPFEKRITARLETDAFVNYLSTAQPGGHVYVQEFNGETLTAPGLAGLKASIAAAGYTDVVVENRQGPARQGIGIGFGSPEPQVVVSFTAAPASGAPTTPVDPEDGE